VNILIPQGRRASSLIPCGLFPIRPTGKMGYAIASEAAKRGHWVALVSGPVHWIAQGCADGAGDHRRGDGGGLQAGVSGGGCRGDDRCGVRLPAGQAFAAQIWPNTLNLNGWFWSRRRISPRRLAAEGRANFSRSKTTRLG